MSELQAGMLALVIGARRVTENIGKIADVICTTISRYPKPEFQEVWDRNGYQDGDWIVSISDKLWSISGQHLLPIKPEADPLDVTHKEELHA